MTECSAFRNTGDGFQSLRYCLIRNCNSYRNDRDGFEISPGSTIIECMAAENGQDSAGFISHGINLSLGSSHAARCHVYNNTGAGIHSNGDFNRVEDNFVRQNETKGIVFTGAIPTLNLRIRNYANSNTGGDYDPAGPNNNLAPVQDAATTTNPFADFN